MLLYALKFTCSLAVAGLLLSNYTEIKQALGTGSNTVIIVIILLVASLIWIWRKQ